MDYRVAKEPELPMKINMVFLSGREKRRPIIVPRVLKINTNFR
jgi:hypothetical protein